MDVLIETPIECPYCGEPITILVDASIAEQAYVEDCQVCCQPMMIRARVDVPRTRFRGAPLHRFRVPCVLRGTTRVDT
jgi:hypothetical protein